jgi:hypothetical protein
VFTPGGERRSEHSSKGPKSNPFYVSMAMASCACQQLFQISTLVDEESLALVSEIFTLAVYGTSSASWANT